LISATSTANQKHARPLGGLIDTVQTETALLQSFRSIQSKNVLNHVRELAEYERHKGVSQRVSQRVSQQILTRLQCDENILTCSTDLRPRWSEESSLTAQEKSGSAYGDRTRISALRGPCPNRLDERANLVNQNGIIIGESSVSSTGFVRLQAKNSSFPRR
jgi:hypothetical protein